MTTPTRRQGTSQPRQLRGVLAARFSDKFRIPMSCLLLGGKMAYKTDPIDFVFQALKEQCPQIHESLWRKLERRARVELGGDVHYIRSKSNSRMVNELLARRGDKEREPSGSMAERIANNHAKKESR